MMNRKSVLVQTSPGDKLMTFVVYFVTLLVALLCFYPLYFTVIASVSDPYAVYTGKISFLPVGFTLESYQEVMKNSQIWQGYMNTIIYTLGGTLFNLVLTIPGAYALSKQRMFGRGFLMMIFVFTMYFSGGMVPTYIMYKNMNLIDTRLILCIVGGVSVYNLIVTRTYFQNSISEELYEAARIDGANELRIFWNFALPLAGPI
ncbi:MAG: carbohydrate ABC transporter permease, partial [Peptococcaceae bacterium]|nr:carbohydrate ABC transporter permease [Peptococcaceae bacterium]